MQHVYTLLLLRLRTPIIVIITVYAIAILGFTLIPGQDDAGSVWRMDFFHAFYFVSFMGSTIGFGEIPYPFTIPQRAWATITIYATVISWLYAIGSIFNVFQDHSFRSLVRRSRFAKRIERIHEPFYLVCGYGVTGNRLVQQLAAHGIRCAVIDSSPAHIDKLEAAEIAFSVPCLCANASDPDVLALGGLNNPLCIGVLALTSDDHANLSIAIDSKLVMPDRMVISRTQSAETTANLASFNTDHIIDPFETFADELITTLREPYKHLIYDVIVNSHHKVWTSPHQDTSGRWVICGYGRLGRALEEKFRERNIEMTFIEVTPDQRDAPKGTILGVGTEAETLLNADIENAVGIIAGTPDDADNLSIIITARDLNPDLITIARQNYDSNKPVFRAADVNIIMEPGREIADEIYMIIRTPLLRPFFQHLRAYDRDWCRELFMKMTATMDDQELEIWAISVNEKSSPALTNHIRRGFKVRIDALMRDPRDRTQDQRVHPLFLKKGDTYLIAPSRSTCLDIGDEVLFCGQFKARRRMSWIRDNYNVLRYVKTGREGPDGLVWRWLFQRRDMKYKKAQAKKQAARSN